MSNKKNSLIEALIKSMKEENGEMYSDIIKFLDDIRQLSENKSHVYITENNIGRVVTRYKDYNNTIEHLKRNELNIGNHLSKNLISVINTNDLAETHMIHIFNRQLTD